MLRRKLLIILFYITGLLILLAVVAVWMFQSVFNELDQIQTYARGMVDQCNELSVVISGSEVELQALRSGSKRHLDGLLDDIEHMQRLAREISRHKVMQLPSNIALNQAISDHLRTYSQMVGLMATTEDPALMAERSIQTIATATLLRDDILKITRVAHQHVAGEQLDFARHFRWLVTGLAIGFILVINLSVLLLMRTAAMILKPIDRLVEASRQLAQEHFSHRVTLDQNDEFDELARAFNSLAGQLEENEARKIETLGQVALTLNHELNNAMAIIELQLRLLQKQMPGGGAQEQYLRQIHDNLQRMTRTIEALKHVRRIVLTDYLEGVKMLDLTKSVQADPGQPGPPLNAG